MINIIFILPNLNAGGAEKVTINYIHQLISKKFKVNLIVFDKTTDFLNLVPKNIKIINLKTKRTKHSFFKLMNEIKNLKPDIIYTTHSRTVALLMFIRPFVKKFTHIARMPTMPSLEKQFNSYGLFSRSLYKLGYRKANIVIAQTKEMKLDAIKVFGIDSQKIKIMHNSLNKNYINSSITKKNSPFKSNQIAGVASGRISFERAFDVLINSVPIVINEYPNFHLYILGHDKGSLEQLKQIINKLKLQNYITFIGFKENPYIYYHNCDLFILSSRWEGFPNAMIENYYLNSPIVATKCVPVVSQLIENGVNGYTSEIENHKDLGEKINLCIRNISRHNIKNPEYKGSNLEDLF